MSVLPKKIDQFSSKEYWDSFYLKKNDEFEWYLEYGQMSELLDNFIQPKDKILVPGCGSSTLSEDLYDVGCRNIVNIDISDMIVKQMAEKNKTKRPAMKFIKQDIFKTDFEDSAFNVILDKGTLDAICTDDSEEAINNTKKMFVEIKRILSVGGHYICISLGQKHIVKELIDHFDSFCAIKVFVHEMEMSHKGSASLASQLPVLVFVLTKMKMELKSPLLELKSTANDSTRRFPNGAALANAIGETQMLVYVKQRLGQTKIDEDITLNLYDEKGDSNIPRYSLTVVDMKTSSKNKKINGKFAIFIVPQGRELEYIFSSASGRQELCEMAAFQRLVIATMHRGHTYASIDVVKSDLSARVMDLSPKGLPKNAMVPFLTADESIGWRHIVYKDDEMIIEDVQSEDGKLYRQLIFKKQMGCIQSQVRLIPAYPDDPLSKSKQKLSKVKYMKTDLSRRQPTYNVLTMEYFEAIFGGLSLIKNVKFTDPLKVLLIGAGGGSVPSYISNTLIQCHVTAVEINKAVIEVSEKYFGLKEKENLRIVTDNGLNVISEMAKQDLGNSKSFDLICFDVNCVNEDGSVSGPPLPFMEEKVLSDVLNLLKDTGVFVVDIVGQNDDNIKQIFKSISKCFHQLWRCKIRDYYNEIIYALPKKNSISNLDEIRGRLELLQQFLKSRKSGENIEIPDLGELCNQIDLIT